MTDHLSEDLLGKSLGDLVDVCLATGGFETCLFGICELLDVAIHGPVDDCNARGHGVWFVGVGKGAKGSVD